MPSTLAFFANKSILIAPSVRGWPWGAPIFAATFVIVFLVLYWRRCWTRTSFWAAMLLAAAGQVPFVILARPLIERRRSYMFTLMVADWALCTLVATLIAQLDSKSPLNSRNYQSPKRR